MKNLRKKLKDQKGFTLVELIIVIAILAVIAGIAAPNLIGNINNSRKKADVANATSLANTVITIVSEIEKFSNQPLTVNMGTAIPGSDEAAPSKESMLFNINKRMQTIPKPKFLSTYNFEVVVTAAGSVTVSVTDGTNSHQVYPTVSGASNPYAD